MREIKFRAWDGQLMHKAFDLTQNPLFWWKDNYDFPLMQYTGLKDKNGVEIYEGDILESGAYRLRVEYDNRLAGWQPMFLMRHDPENYCEVIGNIYENPELLEKAA
jgi:hypothetical protein